MEIANTGVKRLQRVAKNANFDLSDLDEFQIGRKMGKKKLEEMKFALGEFYFSLVLIQNFQVIYKILYFLKICKAVYVSVSIAVHFFYKEIRQCVGLLSLKV